MLIELLIALAIIGIIIRYNIALNYIGIYVLLILATIMNYKFKEILLIFIGVISNLVSFFVNKHKIVFALNVLAGTTGLFVSLSERSRLYISPNI